MILESADLAAEIESITKDIFTTMIMVELAVIPQERYELEKAECNISSMLGLGGQIKGSLDLHFPRDVALFITSQFLGMEIEELDDDVRDAIGEVANMVAGGIKTYLASRNLRTELAIPNTIVGTGYRTHGLAGAEKVKVAFSCAVGMFLAEMKFVGNA